MWYIIAILACFFWEVFSWASKTRKSDELLECFSEDILQYLQNNQGKVFNFLNAKGVPLPNVLIVNGKRTELSQEGNGGKVFFIKKDKTTAKIIWMHEDKISVTKFDLQLGIKISKPYFLYSLPVLMQRSIRCVRRKERRADNLHLFPVTEENRASIVNARVSITPPDYCELKQFESLMT